MKKLFTNLTRMVLYTVVLLSCSFSYATTYYFSSSSGDDNRSSGEAQNQYTPWRSIQKLNSIISSLQPGDNILFKSGDTFQGTIIMTKSGNSGAPITFGSYGSGEKPIITSLLRVTNWTSKGGNIYEAYVGVESDLNIVLMDGKAQAMGRYPNADANKSGYLTINSYGWGYVSSSEMQAPSNFSGGEVVIRKNNWIIDRHSINYHSGTSIGYNPLGSNYSPNAGYGFFIQNHPGTLDQNGEWYYNKQNKMVQVYYNRGNPSSGNIQVSLSDKVIDLRGASNITFSNLAIQGANEDIVKITSGSNITFNSSEIKFAGHNGIDAITTTNFTLQNSLVEDTYNSGIHFQWQDVNLKIINNTFNRNYIFAGMGRNGDMNGNTIYMSATSNNALVEGNKVLNSGYQGINFDGNNTVVKNNLVDTFCFVKDDGAGIYTHTGYPNTTFTNRKVTNNIVINGVGAVDGTKPYGPNDFPYVKGIYMDDNTSGVEIKGNTVAHVGWSGIYIHNSRSLEISDNNVYDVGNSILFVHDNLGDPNRNITMKNNNFLAKTSGQGHVFVRSKYNDANQMGTFDQNVYSKPLNENNTFTLDLPSKKGLINFQSWKDSYWMDRNSSSSPVAFDESKMDIDDFILFEYNYSSSSKSVGLSGTYVDLRGREYSGSISIPAYSSIMLLKTKAGAANAAPSVSITSPSSKSQFTKGNSINITANATDTDGTIAKVEFYNGNNLLGTDTTSPYSFTWSGASTGNFTLTAKATDDKGKQTVSESIDVNVVEAETTLTNVSITSPVSNSQFSQGDEVTITAQTEGSISKVEFYNGSTLLGTDTSSPYSLQWTSSSVGTFNITVKATDSKGSVTTSTPVAIKVAQKSAQSPYGGTPAVIPGTVEAENYDLGGEGVAYHDTDAGNNGGAYRKDDVDIGAASEGGYTLGWMNKNEWLEYTVNIKSAGAYHLNVRLASPASGGKFHIEVDGVDVTGPLTVSSTGGWSNWGSVTKSDVNLPAGQHVLRFVLDSHGANGYFGNLNSMSFTKSNESQLVGNTSPASGSGLLDGLVSFYEMNTNSSGVLRDSHGQNHGVNSQINHTNGFIQNGNKYDGQASISSVPHSNSLNLTTEFSLMADIYREGDAQSKGTVIVGKTLSSAWTENQSYSIGLTWDNRIRIRTNIPYLKNWESTAVVPKGKWVRVIATYKSGEGYSLYLDSTNPEQSGAFSGSITKSDMELTIGSATLQNNSAHQRRFEGVLDNVGIWNRKLSKSEIESLITTKITYPDFAGSNNYRVNVSSTIEDTLGEVRTSIESTEAEAGEQLIFTVEDKENAVFEHWSIDGVKQGNQNLLDLEMPNNDITLTKHFRAFIAPEIKIGLPDDKSEFEASSDVHIDLQLKSNDAIIEKVELFNKEELIGEITNDSTGLSWKNIPQGNHELVARVTDSRGKSYMSDPVILKAVDSKSKDFRDVLLDYKIGPNPTTDYLNVIFTNLDGVYDFEFKVVSMTGIVLKTFAARPEESTVTVDVADLKNGVYVLQLTSNGKNISSKKFIKK